jgi:hypothetical protein
MTQRLRRSHLCVNFATEIEYYPYVIELFSRERGRYFRLDDLAPELGRHLRTIEVSWASIDCDDNQRIVNFIDSSDFWSRICLIMREAYLETYSPLFAKSTMVN